MVLVSRVAGAPVAGSVVAIHSVARASGGWPSSVGRYSSTSGSSTGRSPSGSGRGCAVHD